MKNVYLFLSLLLLSLVSINCGGNKNLQETPPAQIQQAYFTSSGNSMNLYIPVSAIQPDRVALNSVYFRGMQADLQMDDNRPGLYVAKFNTGKEDMVMHSDPREEYGNKVPNSGEKIPFDLLKDEAVLVYTEGDVQKFYKLRGIEQRTQQ